MSFDLTLIGAAAMGILLLVGIGMIVRNLWLAATDPSVAYAAGRKLRRTVKTGAHTAGRVTGSLESAAGVVTQSFREGRDLAKSDGEGSGGGA